jgi:hypothetical protein
MLADQFVLEDFRTRADEFWMRCGRPRMLRLISA